MPRYILDVAYKGTNFFGSQIQLEGPTVQGELQKSLSIIFRKEMKVHAAGRTDRGVHARQMMFHFDYAEDLNPRFTSSINKLIGPDISINEVLIAKNNDFSARFDAVSRRYKYRILLKKSPFETDFAWLYYYKNLDVEKMERAGKILLEYQSFESFCKSGGNQNHYLCDIMECGWSNHGDLIEFEIKANRFLRGMVRAIVGTFLLIGKGVMDENGLRELIEKKDRTQAGQSVPPQGLFLEEVGYPEGLFEKYIF